MISSLYFGSKIIVVSPRTFNQLPLADMTAENGEFSGSNWTVDERVRGKKRGYTALADPCNMGGFHNGDSLVLFHLHPSYGRWYRPDPSYPFEEVRAALTGDAKVMSKKGRKLRGILSGGHSAHPTSMYLFDQLYALMKKLGIQFSVLWGNRFSESSALYCSVPDDTWILHSHRGDRQKISDSPDTLKSTLRVIRLFKGDQLFLEDESRPVVPKDVNQGTLP